MCGIAGIIQPQYQAEVSQKILLSMLDKLQHRGPDEQGFIGDDNFMFGHKRLSIIDLAHGQQPMSSQDGRYVLVFNGEIYNYIELRNQLKQQGIHFHTDSDTEVLLAILIHKKEAAINDLNGMFAFAFYDRKTQEWILARDHFGIKPLYYTKQGGQIIFASEIKAILSAPDIKPMINQKALHQYLTFQFTLLGETLFKNIYELEPATFIKGYQNKIIKKTKYWHVEHAIEDNQSEKAFCEQLQYLLHDSIKLQLRSDVPVGAYLSGGLDSSIVSGLAAQELTDNPLPLFTGRFEGGANFDESIYAEKMASHIHGKLHTITPSSDDFIKLLPKLIYALDQPVAGPGVFPQFMVSQLAKKHVKVVLGGQGGDEVFAGYARYLVAYLEQALKGAIFQTQEEGKHLVTFNSIIPNLPLLQQYTPLMQHFWGEGLFKPMDERYFHLLDRSPNLLKFASNALKQTFDKSTLFTDFQQLFNETGTASYINKMTYFDMKTLLPALLQVEDRVSMAASLEARVPLLDKRIVELVSKMPPALKFRGGKTKNILKEATKSILPDAIVNRKDKMGFPVPLNLWWQDNKMKTFIKDILLSDASRTRGLFDFNLLQDKLNGECFDRELWGLICIELWHQQFIDSPKAPVKKVVSLEMGY